MKTLRKIHQRILKLKPKPKQVWSILHNHNFIIINWNLHFDGQSIRAVALISNDILHLKNSKKNSPKSNNQQLCLQTAFRIFFSFYWSFQLFARFIESSQEPKQYLASFSKCFVLLKLMKIIFKLTFPHPNPIDIYKQFLNFLAFETEKKVSVCKHLDVSILIVLLIH